MSRMKSGNTFKKAVEETPDVAEGFKPGITALGSYSKKIEVRNLSLLQGSIDIDSCTKQKYPTSNRWDYAFAYNGEVLFVEVHTANSSEVKTVINKFNWLKDWLTNQAPEINKLKRKNGSPYYWIQSKSYSIPKTSRQYRLIKSNGLLPISTLKIE